MTKAEVRSLLGEPGSIANFGMAGDVWYYPDTAGGEVSFDSDGHVETWSEP